MIFKKGDKVYDHAYGWGKVCDINDNNFGVFVSFGYSKSSYKQDGSEYHHKPPTLSFTEYTLEGFSQERPKEPLPFKAGDVVYVCDDKSHTWLTIILKRTNSSSDFCFEERYGWRFLATENPLLFPNTRIYTKDDL
jgi:hypothetical protein